MWVCVSVHVCYLHNGCRNSLDPQFPPPSSRQHSCTVDRRHHLLNIGHDLQQQPRTRSGNLKASRKNFYINHRYCVPTAPSLPISLFPSFPPVRVSSLLCQHTCRGGYGADDSNNIVCITVRYTQRILWTVTEFVFCANTG